MYSSGYYQCLISSHLSDLTEHFCHHEIFLYSTVSFVLNYMHFHSFLAFFFLSLSKNVKDAAFLQLFQKRSFSAGLQKRSFSADLRKTCISAAFLRVCRSEAFLQHLHRPAQKLQKRRFSSAFLQVCIKAAVESFVKAGHIGTCRKAAFLQLLRSITIFRNLCVKAS